MILWEWNKIMIGNFWALLMVGCISQSSAYNWLVEDSFQLGIEQSIVYELICVESEKCKIERIANTSHFIPVDTDCPNSLYCIWNDKFPSIYIPSQEDEVWEYRGKKFQMISGYEKNEGLFAFSSVNTVDKVIYYVNLNTKEVLVIIENSENCFNINAGEQVSCDIVDHSDYLTYFIK
jgi:hypothetical protein